MSVLVKLEAALYSDGERKENAVELCLSIVGRQSVTELTGKEIELIGKLRQHSNVSTTVEK